MGGPRAERSAPRAAGGAERGRDLWTHLGKPASRELLLLEPTLRVRLGERGDERRRRREQHRVALADRGPAERDGEMGLADAGRPQEQERLAMRHPAARRQLAQLARIDRGLGGEVEAVE